MTEWYAASLLFVARHDVEPPLEGLWEDRVVLIAARDPAEARQLAESIGKEGEHSYEVDRPVKHVVHWEFVAVERVFEIGEEPLRHGVEIFSRYLRSPEAQALLSPTEVAEE